MLDEYPELLTADEVAGLFRTSREVIYEKTRLGRLPGATRVGRRLLFRRDRLVDYLRKNSVTSPGGDS